MLLETGGLVAFALLFGTTWMVSALVFFAILSSVLLAVGINARLDIKRPALLYAALFATLAVNYLVPVSTLLDIGSPGLRHPFVPLLPLPPRLAAPLLFHPPFPPPPA